VEPLLHALVDEDPAVQQAIAWALGQLGEGPFAEALLSVLLTSSGLGESRPEQSSLPPFLQVLEYPSHHARKTAARILGQRGDPEAVEPLLRALGDRYVSVRDEAVEALEQLGTGPLAQAIRAALEGQPDQLAELGEARAVAPLIRALQEGNRPTQTAAAMALGRLGALAGAALDPLQERLRQEETHEFPLFPEEEQVKQACREALREIEAALRTAPAELTSAPTPHGTGTELLPGDSEGSEKGEAETPPPETRQTWREKLRSGRLWRRGQQ